VVHVCCVQDLSVECVAIINDNVGVLMAGAHSDPNCRIGLILGMYTQHVTRSQLGLGLPTCCFTNSTQTHAVTIAILSVRLSVCHTGDRRQISQSVFIPNEGVKQRHLLLESDYFNLFAPICQGRKVVCYSLVGSCIQAFNGYHNL